MPRSPKKGIDAHIPSRNNPRRYANGAAPPGSTVVYTIRLFTFCSAPFEKHVKSLLAYNSAHARTRQRRVPEDVKNCRASSE